LAIRPVDFMQSVAANIAINKSTIAPDGVISKM
jgi:hypothetical protein